MNKPLDAVEYNKQSAWSNDFKFGGFQSIKSYKKDLKLIKKHLL